MEVPDLRYKFNKMWFVGRWELIDNLNERTGYMMYVRA